LNLAADAVLAAVDDLAPVLTAEQGKPLACARDEVAIAADYLRYYADLPLPREVLQDDDEAFVEILRRPVGVVAAITPWNFPLASALCKVAPALAAGNTVVLKPSPYTPLATLALGQVVNPVLPPGVLNVVSGGDELGEWMTSHPVPAKISFTGSVATGRRVASVAAPDLKRVTLELGGNDPAIVLDDADPQAIADGLFWGAFFNTGQICTAVKRVYAPESLYRPLVDALADRARSVIVGDGAEEGVQLGPINNRAQFERVKELVTDAEAAGGVAVTGGSAIDRAGYFYEPTIIADLTDGCRIVDEEQFGPALPVVAYRHLDDAVARANRTHFGLGGSVWGADADRATAVAARLECGTAWINDHAKLSVRQPSGGVKWSGLGVENGVLGLLGFTEVQVLHRTRKGQ
jgi:acyl-CoA reductase-like NAD-dependent aldehyde dehydrogenase